MTTSLWNVYGQVFTTFLLYGVYISGILPVISILYTEILAVYQIGLWVGGWTKEHNTDGQTVELNCQWHLIFGLQMTKPYRLKKLLFLCNIFSKSNTLLVYGKLFRSGRECDDMSTVDLYHFLRILYLYIFQCSKPSRKICIQDLCMWW